MFKVNDKDTKTMSNDAVIVNFQYDQFNTQPSVFVCNCENVSTYPANQSLLKVNIQNSRKKCEICSKLTITTTERRQRQMLLLLTLSR